MYLCWLNEIREAPWVGSVPVFWASKQILLQIGQFLVTRAFDVVVSEDTTIIS